jgi:protein TonB
MSAAPLPLPRDGALRDYRRIKADARTSRRERALERATTRIDTTRCADPLLHPRTRSAAPTAIWIGSSMGLHVVVVVLGALAPAAPEHDPRAYERSVEIVEPPPPPPPAETAPPTVTPPPEAPIVPQKPVVERVVRNDPPPVAPPQPPPDPVEPPPPDAPRKPARRIVGLDLGSTVVGGSGPAFATGNTRMGETSKVAEAPSAVGRAGAQFTPPRRTHDETPDYPPQLRAQNVEGEVGLKVDIDAHGKITNVAVQRPSPHDEFNRAAVASAWRGTYEPAVLDGAPVANTITFTVRFRLKR